MWPQQVRQEALRPLALVAICFAMVSRSLPLTDAGPHVNHGLGGGNVRLRHLYNSGGLFLSIHSDGRVEGIRTRGLNSLLEITSVAVGTVAIKGVHSSRYLCMEHEGRLQGLLIYSRENCSFVELINDNLYNTYKSTKCEAFMSLVSSRQSEMSEEEDLDPLIYFLPVAY